MKVLRVSLRTPVQVGAKTESYMYVGCETFGLFTADYDSATRMVVFTSKKDATVTLVPLENVTSMQLSEDKKAETPAKASANGGTKTK